MIYLNRENSIVNVDLWTKYPLNMLCLECTIDVQIKYNSYWTQQKYYDVVMQNGCVSVICIFCKWRIIIKHYIYVLSHAVQMSVFLNGYAGKT